MALTTSTALLIGAAVAAAGTAAQVGLALTAPKPPKPKDIQAPTGDDIAAREDSSERADRIKRARGATAKKTVLTSVLGAPQGDQNIFRPTLGSG